jgi:hypothetical protein
MTRRIYDRYRKIYFSDPDKPINWRKRLRNEKRLDDDEEELEKTPREVISILGFDPDKMG